MDKVQRLEETLGRLHKQWGEAVVSKGMSLDHASASISTRFPALDQALGCGGIPLGCLTELCGVPTSGMTTLAYHLIAQAQAQGQSTAYFDLSQTFDPPSAAFCGVEVEKLLLLQPYEFSQALEVIPDAAIGGFGLLVIEALFEPNTAARRHWDHVAAVLRGTNCAVVIITPEAQIESAALRLQVERSAWLFDQDEVIGFRTQVSILRNKFAPPTAPVCLDLYMEAA